MYTNTLLIYLIIQEYIIVTTVPLHEHVCRVVHRVRQFQACRGGGNGRVTVYWEPWQGMKG